MSDRQNAVIREELDGVLADLVIRHDVLPFMMDMHTAAEMTFKPIPDPMLALIVASPDYQPVVAGADPTWFSIAGPDGHAEIIVYRTRCDEEFYVAAPMGNL